MMDTDNAGIPFIHRRQNVGFSNRFPEELKR